MNFGIFLATFALVIPAELPDKTFISCIVMASRHKPLPVWIGGAGALTVQAAIAVLAGRLLELLPRTTVEAIVAALFILGAAYLLLVPEKAQEDKGERLGGGSVEGGEAGEGGTVAEGAAATGSLAQSPTLVSDEHAWKVTLTTFTIVFLAEFGDITQILIANLTAKYREPLAVFLGATAGFMVISAVGVLGGRAIIKVVPLSIVRRISGAALLGLGIYSLVELL